MDAATEARLIENALDMVARQRRSQERKSINAPVRDWLRWRMAHYGKQGVDHSHQCTTNCKNYIRRIDYSMPLYGCDLSGKHHYCESCQTTCTACYLDEDGSYFCVFTGTCVGQQQKWRYCPINQDKSGRQEASEGLDYDDNWQENDDDDDGTAEANAFDDNNNDDPDNLEESAHLMLGDEEGEGAALPRRKRRVHRFLRAEGTTPVRSKRQKTTGSASLLDEARRVLDLLLWDTVPRKKLYSEAVARAVKGYAWSIKKYVEWCAAHRILLSIPTLDQIVDDKLSKLGPKPLEKDLARHEQYAFWILTMWNIMQASRLARDRFHVRFEQHAVGMLYRLSANDITKEGVVLLPKDPWLEENLPETKLITHFGRKTSKPLFTKSTITKGNKHLTMSLLHSPDDAHKLAKMFVT